MKRFLKWLSILIGILLVCYAVIYFMFNEPLPKGEKGPKADALAHKMLKAVDKSAWDSTHIIQWTFTGIHNYLWDKKRNLVEITWGENRVLLNPDQINGKAWMGIDELSGSKADKMIQKAWTYWCNDSFWFNAVVKCFDPGTSRSIVKMEDGSDALMISYESGGVTPGDSYLWILDENGLPKSWKMWVKILPIGGVEFAWENWKTLATGTKVASIRRSKIINLELEMTNIKSATSLKAFGLNEDPFALISH
jgi:hypothetical protein